MELKEVTKTWTFSHHCFDSSVPKALHELFSTFSELVSWIGPTSHINADTWLFESLLMSFIS